MAMASCSHIRKRKDLSKANLELIFQSFYNNPNLKVEKVIDENDNGIGIGYVSEISKLSVGIQGQEHHVSLIIKAPVQSFFQKLLSKAQKQFMREAFWYMKCVPSLKKTYPEIQDFGPKCFHATSTYDENYSPSWAAKQGPLCMMLAEKADYGILIMEDLKDPQRAHGPMKEIDKNAICPIHIAKLIMTKLATFHGIWMSWLENQDPPMIAGLNKEQLMEILGHYVAQKSHGKMFNGIFKGLEKQLTILKRPPELIQALHSYQKNGFYENTVSCLPQKSEYVTFIHGDAWINNFFVNDDETEVTFVDFGQFQTSHPARDFWFFLYLSTDSEWRKNHLETCFETYYKTFSRYFSKANIVMTYDGFKKEFNSKRGLGVSSAFVGIPWVLNDNPALNVSDFKSFRNFLKYLNETVTMPLDEEEVAENIKEINRRLLDLIEESYELGLLK